MSKILILLLIGIWLGLVLGLSFIEAPLKFQAPGISLQLGLGIGQLVFGVLNKIEIALNLLLILFVSYHYNASKIILGATIVLTLIILLQSVVLLPQLNQRAMQIILGENLPTSYHHLAFVMLEILKLIILPTLFIQIYKHITNT